ncbi:hypothetical protein N7448_011325 [Penicillium atrosanguineum]|nr:hypothetical protein N7448_011325 [Penicillium atrosanguineum]
MSTTNTAVKTKTVLVSGKRCHNDAMTAQGIDIRRRRHDDFMKCTQDSSHFKARFKQNNESLLFP